MGKYEPLAQFLNARNEDSWTATFQEVERALGFPLPKSAHEYRAWWSNQQGLGHSQKEGWQAAGWETRDVDLQRGIVRFERAKGRKTTDKATKAEFDQLWCKAQEISGISDRAELEKAALTAFIQREAGRRLIEMGGMDPNARAAPRERPFG